MPSPRLARTIRQVTRLYIHSQPTSKIRLANLDVPDLRAWVAGLIRIKNAGTGQRLGARTIRNAYARLHGARNLMRHLRGITTRAQLGKLTFHQLRRTAGSLILQAGKTMTTVSKILGRSSVGVTEKIYAHSYEDEKRDAVASVTRRLRRAEGDER